MNTNDTPRYTLKQYTRLTIAFFAALVLLTIYQFSVLYFEGVLDTIFSLSILISFIHHMGYASFAGLVCVPIFNFFENWRPKIGFKIVAGIFISLLIIEALLVGYYCMILAPLGQDFGASNVENFSSTISKSWGTLISMVLTIMLVTWLFRIIYQFTKKHYHHIAKMYPFTIILFSVFVATLFLDGKPINKNKTLFLATNYFEKSQVENQNSKNKEFENNEMVWINSVFSGQNYDNAYLTAKKLAYNKKYDKSLLLSRYILYQFPDHIDAKILTGRINAWKGEYNTSILILKKCIKTNPRYVDVYAALLDVYHWSERNSEAIILIEKINNDNIPTKEIEDKIKRARLQLSKKTSKSAQIEFDKNNEVEVVSAENR